jgi:hypothetical protein
MKKINLKISLSLALLTATGFLSSHTAFAHCDEMDGPVVKSARKALADGNANLVLIWVQKNDETQMKEAFNKTLAARKLNKKGKELADQYFFETLVRIHRAGEGAPITGLKPAGRDLGPAIPAGDRALDTGDVEPVVKLMSEKMEHGARALFKKALARKQLTSNDVEAERAFVKAYVEFIHYIEGLQAAAASQAHGHFPEPEGQTARQENHRSKQ